MYVSINDLNHPIEHLMLISYNGMKMEIQKKKAIYATLKWFDINTIGDFMKVTEQEFETLFSSSPLNLKWVKSTQAYYKRQLLKEARIEERKANVKNRRKEIEDEEENFKHLMRWMHNNEAVERKKIWQEKEAWTANTYVINNIARVSYT